MESLRFIVILVLIGLVIVSAHGWEKSRTKKASFLHPKPTRLSSTISSEQPLPFSEVNDLLAYNNQNRGNDQSYSYKSTTAGSSVSGGSVQERIRHALPYLTQANPASIAILFALLIWRLLSVYELADSKGNQLSALLTKYGTLAMLLTNVLAFLAAIFRPVVVKNYLKVILAFNILREWLESVYNIWMILTAKSVLRDMHFGRLLMNCWWGYLCFSFSKSRWVAQVVPIRFEQPAQEQF